MEKGKFVNNNEMILTKYMGKKESCPLYKY